jgi:hypothetical protein
MTAVDIAENPDGGPTSEPAKTIRTPFYRANNAPRYERQTQIRAIQDLTKSKLVCYIGGPQASLSRDDALPLVDLFHTIPVGSDIDLLLHTVGGDIDAAEKMASMLRKRVGDRAKFRVVVPDHAKSAGTLITLAADTVVMSDSSELGPVDPQLNLPDGHGRFNYRPAQSYVDGYEALVKLVNDNPSAAGYRQMLDKYDPTTLDMCRKVLERSVKLGESLLQQGMFRGGGGNFTAVAGQLADNHKWLWHGVPIDYIEAKKLGLNVTYLELDDPLWQQFWALYCSQRLEVARISEDCKLFESDYVSIPMQ